MYNKSFVTDLLLTHNHIKFLFSQNICIVVDPVTHYGLKIDAPIAGNVTCGTVVDHFLISMMVMIVPGAMWLGQRICPASKHLV